VTFVSFFTLGKTLVCTKKKLWKMIRKALYIITGSAALGGIYQYNTNNDLKRKVILWKEIGPIITRYRFTELKEKLNLISELEAEKEYHDLHSKYSTPVMETLRDLRGFFIKVGQVLANRSDILPEIYIEKLRTLEDQVPHLLNGEQAKELVVQSLGLQSLQDLFLEFSDNPIGSASIGQVHKARLRNGNLVAVKVQSPGSELLFRSDIKSAKEFCKFFAPEQVIIFDEIEKQFMMEFDYNTECQNLETVRMNMKKFRGVVVPKAYPEYTSKHVLTMEFINGPKLVDGIRQNGREYAALKGTTFEQLEKDMRKEWEEHGLPPVYKGPGSFSMNLYRSALMFKDMIVNTPTYLINKTLSLLYQTTCLSFFNKQCTYSKSFIPLNSSFIMDVLLQAHGHQILIDGVFNADVHPGNFLMMDDGRIGMVDYGQVKVLSREQRLLLAKLVLALANNDQEGVIETYKETGYKSMYGKGEVMYQLARVTIDQDGRNITGGLNLQQFVDQLYASDPWVKAVDWMIMPVRMSLLLRGVGLMLGHPVSVCTQWKPIAEKALRDAGRL
jgi:aarF domain-containing kinase